ncbi:MmpS family transport accessory protein [Streptomyces sp. NPDC006798]|uniref:MmpS family transport accessory protein n=1 Tax=Streptomyces sp. NPDC006798 TaxID=3155462 RepID=UPI0033FFCC02
MRRNLRHTAIAAFATAGLVFGLSACSEVEEAAKDKATDAVDKTVNKEYQVTYEVTGASIDSIEFANGEGTALKPTLETVKNPKLPWTKTVTLRGIMAPTVIPSAVDLTASANITCKVTHEGKVLVEKKSEGAAAISACVAVSPIAESKLP